MSSVGNRLWDLYLGPAGSALARIGGSPGWETHASVGDGVVARFGGFHGSPLPWRRPVVNVWLSGALAHPFLLERPQGLKNGSELHAWAKVKGAEAAGLAGPCSVWLDAATASDSIMGVAMDAGLQAAIANAAKLARVQLATVRPWWALALDEQLATHSATELFVAEDPDSVTVLTGKNDAWLSAHSYAPKLSATQLESLIARRLFASVSATTSAKRVRMSPVGSESINWLQAQSIASFAPA